MVWNSGGREVIGLYIVTGRQVIANLEKTTQSIDINLSRRAGLGWLVIRSFCFTFVNLSGLRCRNKAATRYTVGDTVA